MEGRRFSKQGKDRVVAIVTMLPVCISVNDFGFYSSFDSNGKLSARDILGCENFCMEQ